MVLHQLIGKAGDVSSQMMAKRSDELGQRNTNASEQYLIVMWYIWEKVNWKLYFWNDKKTH